MPGTLYITGDDAADDLLNNDGFALVIGMLLDQQVPMEWAFRGPAALKARLGGELDARTIAAMDPDDLVRIFCEKPALHRYPANMARRLHALTTFLVQQYDGDATQVWKRSQSGLELLNRVQALPGFGKEKAQIFVALLAKRMGVALPGWQEAAGAFGDDEPRSVADAESQATLEKVRAWKQAMKAAKKDKQGRALAE